MKPFLKLCIIIGMFWTLVPIASYFDSQLALYPETRDIVFIEISPEPTVADVFFSYLTQNIWEAIIYTAGALLGAGVYWKELRRIQRSLETRFESR